MRPGEIPGTQRVLIASQGKSEIYDLAHDVLVTGDTAGDSSGGVFENFAITTDGRYLIASDVLDGQMALGALTPQDRLQNLCDMAGGSGMSRHQWAVYVGNLATYSDPCTGSRAAIDAFYNVARQGEFLDPPQLVSAQHDRHYPQGLLRPARQSRLHHLRQIRLGKLAGTKEAICVDNTLKWVVPNAAGDSFRAGTVNRQDIRLVSGKITPRPNSTDNTAIDVLLPDSVAASTTATNGTIAITPSGVQVIETQGTIRVPDTFGPDKQGYWRLISAVPAGLT